MGVPQARAEPLGKSMGTVSAMGTITVPACATSFPDAKCRYERALPSVGVAKREVWLCGRARAGRG